ncbi:pesticin C-terminus-like muramidase [Acetobacter sp. DsW_063]|uniref:pesticin C-terminus-like muramidase n=1 Tax=Acetobacter sp. DsW_063 TaxID=1514894 RepID=UPI000A3B6BD0|nr:pesticin C-terminus-like muramidase [Acetobacter sp. DsW_063]OUJ16108.1 hypothetical protein HK28_05875 [Acetobacter sp. DsW_063]
MAIQTKTAPRPYVPVDAAWKAADERVTILDDRIDIEDDAVFIWLKAHLVHAHGHGLQKTVIGTGLLPPAWRAVTRRFASPVDVQNFMNTLGLRADTVLALQTLYRQLTPAHQPIDRATLLREIGNAIICGQAWVLESRRMKSRFSTKTSEQAFAVINPKLGTNINFQFIANAEGDQWLRGYVPMQHGVVIGQSGMTVASGFDLGQWSVDEMTKQGFSETLLQKIRPFANRKMRHMTKAQVVALVATLGPVPILTKEEADACDTAVFTSIASGAMRIWNARIEKGVPLFTALPQGWQTVWISRFYQEGPGPKFSSAIDFRSNALAGNWKDAIAALQSYTQYRDRIASEANLLQQQMPPEVTTGAVDDKSR